MLILNKFFFSPDEGAGAAAPAANDDDLLEMVEDSDAGSDKQLVDGVNAGNTPDTEGEPLNSESQNDDDSIEEEYKKLIKGRFAKVHQKHIEGIIGKRFKGTKKAEEELEAMKAERESYQPLFNAMAARYGLDPKDIKGIIEAADKDNSNFENEAFAKGFGTAAAYREFLAKNAEVERLTANERQREEAEKTNAQRDQLVQGWLNEAKAFETEIPEFDFKTELENERFRYFLNSGFSVADSYKMTHVEEYAEAKARAAAKNAEKTTMREVKANRARPTESAANPSASVRVKKAISDMTLADTERLIMEAKRGKKIPL